MSPSEASWDEDDAIQLLNFSVSESNHQQGELLHKTWFDDDENQNGTQELLHVTEHRNLVADPLRPSAQFQARSTCLNNQRKVKIKIKTDQYGFETSWTFRRKGTATPLFRGPDNRNYESSTLYQGTFCANIGMYEFVIRDLFKDGICCGSGQGFFSVQVQKENGSWRQAVRGGKFTNVKRHIIDVGKTESTMTNRDKAYLVAHNTRRKDWHARYNKEYVPLKWSKGENLVTD